MRWKKREEHRENMEKARVQHRWKMRHLRNDLCHFYCIKGIKEDVGCESVKKNQKKHLSEFYTFIFFTSIIFLSHICLSRLTSALFCSFSHVRTNLTSSFSLSMVITIWKITTIACWSFRLLIAINHIIRIFLWLRHDNIAIAKRNFFNLLTCLSLFKKKNYLRYSSVWCCNSELIFRKNFLLFKIMPLLAPGYLAIFGKIAIVLWNFLFSDKYFR